ncbi:hypothetical protein MBM_09332 [Drepanopeziza brunnea f. sp. 'multigermtubi' MB_m1]|uniref:Uncharacterized protein n=1 Tax=Marssonina brunnea f. sp. multigermtubi (strain MB_m1) TaxID=1072389 RepID=K1WHW7_MARBU|nr:uncharacterized protein MBM_09332 [Drepanopeziza brunnea f. sp. 'multigermtubi' MB_m1]EKD12466.1 hypothetical protein MBM_09332 [Drepanopeziza brunnea f. sp. 'multigermtubi' MB_m1]
MPSPAPHLGLVPMHLLPIGYQIPLVAFRAGPGMGMEGMDGMDGMDGIDRIKPSFTLHPSPFTDESGVPYSLTLDSVSIESIDSTPLTQLTDRSMAAQINPNPNPNPNPSPLAPSPPPPPRPLVHPAPAPPSVSMSWTWWCRVAALHWAARHGRKSQPANPLRQSVHRQRQEPDHIPRVRASAVRGTLMASKAIELSQVGGQHPCPPAHRRHRHTKYYVYLVHDRGYSGWSGGIRFPDLLSTVP